MYAQLGDSYQWKQLNFNDALINKINTVMEEGRIIYPSDIPSTMLKIKNRIKSPITSKVIDSIDSGEIVMIYAPTIKMPLYLPFIVSQASQHTYVGYVFLNNIVISSDIDGKEMELNERQLKVVLETCYITIQTRRIGDSPKLRSTALMKSGSKIYSGIVTECINRKHNIKLDANLYNCLLYLTSKYYIFTVMGCKNMAEDALDNYCLYNCKQFDILEMSRITKQFTNECFTDIGTFIKSLTEAPDFNKRLGKMTVSNFLESYINMYDTPMLFGLEVFPYFLYNILSVNDATYVNNYQSLKNIVGDDGKKIYADLIVGVC